MSDTLPPRPVFSNGQYIGADDLNAEVAYARDETERSVLSGRTWGIATGLALVEIADATGATQMFIEPGIAWDGYGRPVVVISPAPISASLFSALPTGNPWVWLCYNAVQTQMIAPGFQTCGTGDPATRISETYTIVVGNPATTQWTAGVVINGVTVPDPRNMLIAVDTAAAVVLDGSAPHQIFPSDSTQWLIPVGIVAYTAGSPGSFSPRTPTQLALSRAARHYMGAVAESVFAADGVLRLRDRQTDQITGDTNNQLAIKAAIQPTDIAPDPNNATRLIGNELVWVEGNMRVTGNARMFGTRLELRDQNGLELGAPEFLRRGTTITNTNTLGGQDLQISIGTITGTAGVDRLTIGMLGTTDATHPDGVLSEVMVVRTDGKAALGTTAIDSYSTLANSLVISTLTDTGLTIVSGSASTGNVFFADGTQGNAQKSGFVSYNQGTQELTLGAGGNEVLGITNTGQVVIGPADPTQLDPDSDQLVVSNGSNDAAGITIVGTIGSIDFANGTVASAGGFIRYNQSDTEMEFGTASTAQVYIDGGGRIGIATAHPYHYDGGDSPLVIVAGTGGVADITLSGPVAGVKFASSTATAEGYISFDTNSSLMTFGTATQGQAYINGNGQVGIGTSAPAALLHVRTGSSATGLIVDQSGGPTALTAVNGLVGVGFNGTPRTALDVRALAPALGVAPNNHVAVMENTWIGPGNVLALKLDTLGPLVLSNYITFIDGQNNEIGAIEGYNWLGINYVQLVSYGAADYAEAVLRVAGAPSIGAGHVVGVRNGQVSTTTDGADSVFVTSAHPAVLGNAPARDKRDAYETLAFIGQVSVTVDGPVRPGDLIVASGKADGVGRAVALDDIQVEHLPLIVGRAWAAADGRTQTQVNALVGPGVAGTPAVAVVLARHAGEVAQHTDEIERQRLELERQAHEIERQGREIERLAAMVEELRAEQG